MILAIVLIAAGAYILFTARVWIVMKQRTHARRLEDRLERGEDAYADELRSLQTYTPDGKVGYIRFLGAAMIVWGAIILILPRVS